MNRALILAAAIVCGPGALSAQDLELVSSAGPQYAFASDRQSLSVTIRNRSDSEVMTEVWAKLFQVSSATAAPVDSMRLKTIRLLPHQTIVERLSLDFPGAMADAHFAVQLWDGTNRMLGALQVHALPTNFLAQRLPPASAVLDPAGQFRSVLEQAGVIVRDLESAERFSGPLVIVFHSALIGDSQPLADTVATLAKRGIAVVWVLPPTPAHDKAVPSFYTITDWRGAIVVAQHELVPDAKSPRAQFNLVQLAEAALHPEPMALPRFRTQERSP